MLSRRRHGRRGRGDELAELVLYLTILQRVLDAVRQLRVADRTGRLLDEPGDLVIADRRQANGPRNELARADAGFPFRADLRQVVREHVGRAARILAVHDRDLAVGKLDRRVEGGQGRVVPLLDLAQEYVAQHQAAEPQRRLHLTQVNAFERALDAAFVPLTQSRRGLSDAYSAQRMPVLRSAPRRLV